jgi:hypothetical protein
MPDALSISRINFAVQGDIPRGKNEARPKPGLHILRSDETDVIVMLAPSALRDAGSP